MNRVAVSAPIPTGQPLIDPLRRDAKPWQSRSWVQLLAAFAAVVPIGMLLTWTYVLRMGHLTIGELLVWPLLGGGGLILWLLFLHILVCGDSLESLGLRKDRVGLDLLLGAAGSLLLLVMKLGFQATLARLFPASPPSEEIVELLSGLSRSPWLLALFLGPVVWIGVAGFEELWRGVMLRRLWRVSGRPATRWAAVLAVSALFGLAHSYQGPAAVVDVGLISIPMGWFFMATGRLRALIVAHALYDSIQIVVAMVIIRQALP